MLHVARLLRDLWDWWLEERGNTLVLLPGSVPYILIQTDEDLASTTNGKGEVT
jgi:hypothetical protein